jgi:hypothetical protein
MVQFVETWLLTDLEALAKSFPGLARAKLPTHDLESRSKADISRALRRATEDTKKGPYRHGHAHDVIFHVRSDRVETLKHGKKFFESLTKVIKGTAV